MSAEIKDSEILSIHESIVSGLIDCVFDRLDTIIPIPGYSIEDNSINEVALVEDFTLPFSMNKVREIYHEDPTMYIPEEMSHSFLNRYSKLSYDIVLSAIDLVDNSFSFKEPKDFLKYLQKRENLEIIINENHLERFKKIGVFEDINLKDFVYKGLPHIIGKMEGHVVFLDVDNNYEDIIILSKPILTVIGYPNENVCMDIVETEDDYICEYAPLRIECKINSDLSTITKIKI